MVIPIYTTSRVIGSLIQAQLEGLATGEVFDSLPTSDIPQGIVILTWEDFEYGEIKAFMEARESTKKTLVICSPSDLYEVKACSSQWLWEYMSKPFTKEDLQQGVRYLLA